MNKKLRLPSHKSWQPLLRKAAAVAVALGLGASGVAAWAANDGVIVPNGSGGGTGSGGSGGGVGGTVEVKWMVKDSWAASRDGVLQALSDMGYPENSDYEHDGNIATIDAAISTAVNECRATYTGSDDPQCRLVAVGIAGESGSHRWNHTSNWGDAKTWIDAWDAETSGRTYYHNGAAWDVNLGWNDKKGLHSVATLASDVINANLNAAIRLIVLAKNQPVPSTYNLSLTTQASGFSQAGYTGQVSDKITTKSNTDIRENVTGDSWLTWRGLDGTTNRIKKQWTASNNGSTTVTVNKEDMSANWKYWPLGKYWFDTHAAKQGKMSADANHAGEHDAAKSWSVTQITPPVKTLTNAAGETVEGGQLPSGSVYTAHITARSEGSKHFWLYDTIDTTSARVVIGGSQQDDFNQITV